MEMNISQKKAVEHLSGPMMVLAGPGSGKTTVIAHRVKYLIEERKIAPEKILVITFTKAAAEEMESRFAKLENDEVKARKVTFGTFHSVFFRIIRSALGYRLENILKEDERKYLLRSIVRSLKIEFEDEEEFLKDISLEISLMKNELIDVKYYNTMVCSNDDFEKIVEMYENYKLENNKIDFDDMLCICWKLLNENEACLKWWQKKYDYVLIDEFQDINRVQYETVKELVKIHNNIFIVGDDDQSIYKFRGARPEFLLSFPDDFQNVKSVVLDTNYRSTDNIIELANKLIVNNKQRYEKNIKGVKGKNANPILLISDNIEEEARLIGQEIKKLHKKGIAYKDTAVIFRTNIQARAFVDKFMDMNIPFYMRDEMPNLYEHWIAKDLISYIKLSENMHLNDDLERIINKPKRYISKLILQSAKREGGSLIYSLMNLEDVKVWQRERLEELELQLQIIKKRTPFEALKYIRGVIGYDDYLKEYADFRKVGAKSLLEVADEIREASKNYKTHQEFLNHIEEFSAELRNQKLNKKKVEADAVALSTLHGSKGLEFDTVFISSAVEGVIPHEKSKTEAEIEEERRLFYVGITRAKQFLYISTIKTRYEEKVGKSQFLKEIKF